MSRVGFDPAARERARQKLAALPGFVRDALKAQLEKEAADLVAEQKQLAPNRTGTLQGSIEHRDTSTDTRLKQTVTAGGEATTKPVVEGKDGSYDYAFGVEFGNERMAANPFFYPPARRRRRGMQRRLAEAVQRAIRGVAQS